MYFLQLYIELVKITTESGFENARSTMQLMKFLYVACKFRRIVDEGMQLAILLYKLRAWYRKLNRK